MLEILGYGLCGLIVLIGIIPVFIAGTRADAHGLRFAAWSLLFCVGIGALVLGVSVHEQADQARRALQPIGGAY